MRAWTPRSLPALSVLFFGCSSTDGDVDTGNRGTILLSDSANYNTTSSLTLPRVETAAAVDLDICWEQMTDDIRCHDVRPAEDVDNVAMLRFAGLTPEQVEQRLGAGELPQSELDAYFDYNTDHSGTCTQLSSMEFFGTPIHIEQDARGDDATLVLVFTQGTTPGVGALNMLIFAPSSASDNTRIDAMPGCGILDFSADIQSSQPLEVVNEAPWIVDWRDVTVDGLGNDLATTGIDRILLGYYEGTTVADLEAQIFDLEIIATEMWEVELEEAAFTADLAQAKSRTSGVAFSGFDRSDGTWAVALMCSTCQNPAPLVLSVLRPTDGGT